MTQLPGRAIAVAAAILTNACGTAPLGWVSGAGPDAQTVLGRNNLALDIPAVQRALDRGGTVLLKGEFNFGDTGNVKITRDVTLIGESGQERTRIKGGRTSIRSLPPEGDPRPAPKIEIARYISKAPPGPRSPKETLSLGIWVVNTTGIRAEIAMNKIRNASRRGMEVTDNYLGRNGEGQIAIHGNSIETPADGAPFPSPRTPNGILVGYYMDPAAAVDPKRSVPLSVMRNTIRARGQTPASTGIGVLMDGAHIRDNHLILEGQGTLPRRPPKVPHLWPPKLLHSGRGDLTH